MAALAAVEIEDLGTAKTDRRREAQLERELAAARARIELLEREHRKLNSRLAEIAALAAGTAPAIVTDLSHEEPRPKIERKPARTIRLVTSNVATASGDSLHPAARKLLLALAQDARRGSPGGRPRRLPVSNQAAAISMPAARICASSNMLRRQTV
jgi:hypothetical protein